jgi:hypothetical protein
LVVIEGAALNEGRQRSDIRAAQPLGEIMLRIGASRDCQGGVVFQPWKHTWKTGEIVSRAECAVPALVIPPVAGDAPPGVRPAAGIGALRCPQRHVAGRGLHIQFLEPIVIQPGASDDVFIALQQGIGADRQVDQGGPCE